MYMFEQAGKQKQLVNVGEWVVEMPEEDIVNILKYNPDVAAEWDERVGDKIIKLVFIGKGMDIDAITKDLDSLLK